MSNRKKKLWCKEEIFQYVYDYGIEEASKILGLEEEKINIALGLSYKPYTYVYNNKKDKPLYPNYKLLMNVIADHYNQIYQLLLNNVDNNVELMNLDIKDLYHNAIISLVEKGLIFNSEDLSEDNIIFNFIVYFKTNYKYLNIKNNIQKCVLKSLEVKTNNNDYFNLLNINNNALFEED